MRPIIGFVVAVHVLSALACCAPSGRSKPATVEQPAASLNEGTDYFVDVKEEKRAVDPGSSFLTVSVVFNKTPIKSAGYAVLEAVVTREKAKGLDINANAYTGTQDHATWQPIRDSDGVFWHMRHTAAGK